MRGRDFQLMVPSAATPNFRSVQSACSPEIGYLAIHLVHLIMENVTTDNMIEDRVAFEAQSIMLRERGQCAI
jgi:hypothetical protein